MDNKYTVYKILKKFLDELIKNHESYVILGNYLKEFDLADGDIDIAVAHDVFKNIPEFLLDFCSSEKIYLTQLMRHEVTSIYACLVWFDDDGNLKNLNLDICSDYMFNGVTYFTANEFLAGSIKSRNGDLEIRVPNDRVNLEYYAIKKFLKREVPNEASLFQNFLFERLNEKDKIAVCSSLFGENLTSDLEKAFSWDVLFNFAKKGQRWRNRKRFSNITSELKRLYYRMLWPSGLIVAFLGPDGSGKTTIIEQNQQALRCCFRRSDYFHLRPRLLNASKQGKPVLNPHALEPRGIVASIAKLLYFYIDYRVGFWAKVTWKKARSSFVIFDRYFHDLYIDQRRYRLNLSRRIISYVSGHVPSPDVWIILTAPVDVILTRKAEVSYAECNRQISEYEMLANELPKAKLIKTNTDVKTSCYEVQDYIFKTLNKRLTDRVRSRKL
jgi:thymidylate kinase